MLKLIREIKTRFWQLKLSIRKDVFLLLNHQNRGMFSEYAEEPGHFKDELEIAKQLNHPCPDQSRWFSNILQCLAMASFCILQPPGYMFTRYVVKLYEVFQTGECVHLVRRPVL